MKLTRRELNKIIREALDPKIEKLRGGKPFHAGAEFFAQHFDVPYEVFFKAKDSEDMSGIVDYMMKKGLSAAIFKSLDDALVTVGTSMKNIPVLGPFLGSDTFIKTISLILGTGFSTGMGGISRKHVEFVERLANKGGAGPLESGDLTLIDEILSKTPKFLGLRRKFYGILAGMIADPDVGANIVGRVLALPIDAGFEAIGGDTPLMFNKAFTARKAY